MSDNDNDDTTTYVAENSDTSRPPRALGEDTDWQCKACGTPVEDAHALANHECED